MLHLVFFSSNGERFLHLKFVLLKEKLSISTWNFCNPTPSILTKLCEQSYDSDLGDCWDKPIGVKNPFEDCLLLLKLSDELRARSSS